MLNFPIYKYPTGAETDPTFLYQSLGSFWTQIFTDQAILKGYLIGQAEEIIQRYYDLIETVNAYAVKEVPVFHKEKWFPIQILKSQFDSQPFVFEQGAAVFGAQASNDPYYSNAVFQFGFSKRPTGNVYIYEVGPTFEDFGVIADCVLSPSNLFVKGADVILTDGVLYFNTNLFDNPTIPTTQVIGTNGVPTQYTDDNGNLVNDELMILWAYQGQVDESILFNNFGYIFDLNLNNDQFFKDILVAIFALFVCGPTVNAVTSICAAFLGVTPIISPQETVQEVFADSDYQYVVTDQNVYKLQLTQNILPTVVPGAVFQAGAVLTDAVAYYDNVSAPGWWKSSSVVRPKLALSQYLFLGNYSNQFILSNSVELITVNAQNEIVFPIEGSADDLAQFQAYLNNSNTQLQSILGLNGPGSSVPIQPVDFVMENFLKANTALVKFKFATTQLQSQFLSLLPILQKVLPPYMYIIYDLELDMVEESYNSLNGATPIVFTSGTITLNSDGSDNNGLISSLSPYYFNNPTSRLFSISLGILAQPYETVGTSGTGSNVTMKDGKPMPAPPDGAGTATFNKLRLLDFYS